MSPNIVGVIAVTYGYLFFIDFSVLKSIYSFHGPAPGSVVVHATALPASAGTRWTTRDRAVPVAVSRCFVTVAILLTQ